MGVGQLKVEVDPSWRHRMIAGLLRGYKRAARSGVHPYDKWKGAHWRLVSLVELGVTRTDRTAHAAAEDVYLSRSSGQPIHPEWTHIHWPHYWHYDFFHGLRAIAMLGRLADPRASQALTLLRSLWRSDGTWRTAGRRYWRLRGGSTVELVDWGNAHEIVTPNALAMVQ